MDFDLTDEQRLLRDTVPRVRGPRGEAAGPWLDREKRSPYELVERMGGPRANGHPVSRGVRRGGADTLSYALAVEELTRIDSSVAITMAAHTSLGTTPIYMFGSEAQKQDWLPDLTSGRRLATFGLTEPEAGSDAFNVRTRATLDGDEWVINGAKQFITNPGTEISACVSITAVTGDSGAGAKEISNLIVPNGTPGYEIGEAYRKSAGTPPTPGRWRSTTAGFRRRTCSVHTAAASSSSSRSSRSSTTAGSASRRWASGWRSARDEALAYAKQRKAFGQSISRFQTIQAKLADLSADLSAEIEAARLLTYKAAVQKDHGEEFGLTAAQAKLKTGRLAVRAAEEAVQIHGGYGYIEEYPVARFYRDAKILTIGEGSRR